MHLQTLIVGWSDDCRVLPRFPFVPARMPVAGPWPRRSLRMQVFLIAASVTPVSQSVMFNLSVIALPKLGSARKKWVSCHALILRLPRGQTESSSPLTVAYPWTCWARTLSGAANRAAQNKNTTRQTVSAVAQNQFALTKGGAAAARKVCTVG